MMCETVKGHYLKVINLNTYLQDCEIHLRIVNSASINQANLWIRIFRKRSKLATLKNAAIVYWEKGK